MSGEWVEGYEDALNAVAEKQTQDEVVLARVHALCREWTEGTSIEQTFGKRLDVALSIHKSDPANGRTDR